MWDNIGYDKCLSFIECQFRTKSNESSGEALIRPTITISRLPGAGGHTVASKLAEYLLVHVPAHCEWTVFDRNLVEKALEDHHLHKRIAEYIPETHKSMLTDTLEELLGFHPSSWTIVQYTTDTILRLVQMGNVIIVGRAGNVITSKLRPAFHVRLIGSLEKRIARVQEVYNLGQKAAAQFIKKEAVGRKRYLQDNFGKDIDDSLLYHLTVNMDLVQYDDAARLIGDEVIKRFQLNISMCRQGNVKTDQFLNGAGFSQKGLLLCEM